MSNFNRRKPAYRKPSPNPAQSSPCPYSARCGGCSRVHIPYGEQLKMKQAAMEKLLSGICPVEPILGMSNPWHYRSKVHAVIGTDFKTKRPISGVYQRGTHRVVPVQGCLIEDERADRIIQTIVGMITRYKLRIYNENTHRGFLRHVLVRTGHVTGQMLVVLVATAAEFPGGKAFVAELIEKHPEITSVVLNVNQKETSMVLGTKDIILHGTGYMEDELCGKRFRISPQSFYQVNLRQTEVLYRTAIEYAGLTGGETLLDAYCGTGTIGLCASDHVKRLIGVELNADAVRDAKENARINGVQNARFFCDDAGRFMVKMARDGQPLDVLIMDPPRAGSDEKFLSSVLTLKPRTVVYVSCNPETLARDAAYLVKGGYTAVKAVPVDMFPCTEHCECVMLFQWPGAK
jgi:23S rRNA (uracil1939-C5)-methyltransferase